MTGYRLGQNVVYDKNSEHQSTDFHWFNERLSKIAFKLKIFFNNEDIWKLDQINYADSAFFILKIQKPKISSKIRNFIENPKVHQKSKSSSKIQKFIKNPKVHQKSKSSSKIQKFIENPKVHRKPKSSLKIRNFIENPKLVTKWSLIGPWIVDVISFQKIYGLHGLMHVIKVKRRDVTPFGGYLSSSKEDAKKSWAR